MELKIDEGEGLKFETPILDTLQSYEDGKRRKKSLQMMFLQEVVRRATELFVGVTLLSLLVALFTGLSVIHSYTYYAASTFFFPLLSRVLQRKYMFIVCNVIVVFLIRCISRSSLYSSSTSPEQQGDDAIELVQEGTMRIETHNADHQNQYELEDDKEEEEDKALEVVVTAHPRDLDKQVLMDDDEENEDEDWDQQKGSKEGEVDEGRSELESVVGEDGGDNVKEKVNNAERRGMYYASSSSSNTESTEELNKKIEEFIRKMKRELQLEVVDAHSPQHLIPA